MLLTMVVPNPNALRIIAIPDTIVASPHEKFLPGGKRSLVTVRSLHTADYKPQARPKTQSPHQIPQLLNDDALPAFVFPVEQLAVGIPPFHARLPVLRAQLHQPAPTVLECAGGDGDAEVGDMLVTATLQTQRTY